MSKANHFIEPEELMAYLDGELSVDRAALAAEHLEQCRECHSLAASLRGVSQGLMAWEVEAPEIGITPAVAAEFHMRDMKRELRESNGPAWRGFFTSQRIMLAGGVAVVALLVFAVSIPNLLKSRMAANNATEAAQQRTEALTRTLRQNLEPTNGLGDAIKGNSEDKNGALADYSNGRPLAGKGVGSLGKFEKNNESYKESNVPPAVPTGPMIIHTAQITLSTKDFEKTRAGVEDTLKRHNGYVGQMNVTAPVGGARTLNAVLRVPASQLESTLAELKALGRVEAESQGGEEVTQRYVDLEARLANARNSEVADRNRHRSL